MSWASTPRPTNLCPRCGQREKGAELILQARSLERRPSTYHGTRAKRLCLQCAREVFALMEYELDRPGPPGPP